MSGVMFEDDTQNYQKNLEEIKEVLQEQNDLKTVNSLPIPEANLSKRNFGRVNRFAGLGFNNWKKFEK
jgi:hypothetical protein